MSTEKYVPATEDLDVMGALTQYLFLRKQRAIQEEDHESTYYADLLFEEAADRYEQLLQERCQ
jgi:hypothetical protein